MIFKKDFKIDSCGDSKRRYKNLMPKLNWAWKIMILSFRLFAIEFLEVQMICL